MKQITTIKLSGFFLLIVVISFFVTRTIGFQTSLLHGGDQFGYNSYLTTIFNNGNLLDLTTSNLNRAINGESAPTLTYGAKGYPVIKYTYGVALLQLPFFMVTHLIYKGTGYELPYLISIYLSTFFYVILGLMILTKFLNRHVNINLAILTSLLLFIGTNLLYFTSCFPGMSHPYLFFLFTLLIYSIPKYYERPNIKYAFILGSLFGLIIITRPVEAPVCFIFLLYGLSDKNSFKERIRFFIHNFRHVLIILMCIGLLTIPQLLYWKYATGQWLYDGYAGEGFDFLHPHILEGLFSFKNGWLTYSPLLIIPIIYLLKLSKELKDYLLPLITYLIITIYITYSWKDWNYNAGLGSRPMLEGYAFLALPFCYFFKDLVNKRLVKCLIFIFIFFCIYLNILRTWQMQTGNFISEDATYTFNKNMLFKLRTSLQDLYAFDLNENQPVNENLKFISKLGNLDFENSNSISIDSIFAFEGNKSEKFVDGQEFGEALICKIPTTARKGDYVKITFWAYVTKKVNHYQMGRMVFSLEKERQSLIWKSIRIDNKLGATIDSASLFGSSVKKWMPVQYFIRLDSDYSPSMILKVYGWNPGNADFWIDNIASDLFRDINMMN